jgi:hypothetical protein
MLFDCREASWPPHFTKPVSWQRFMPAGEILDGVVEQPDAVLLLQRVGGGKPSCASLAESKCLVLQWMEFRWPPAAAYESIENVSGRNGPI